MSLPPLGVKAGALAACVVKVAFLDIACRFAGVNEGDSTLSDFLWLELRLAMVCTHPALLELSLGILDVLGVC